MNKTELINAVADKTQLSKKDAEAAITATVEAIAEALTREEKVQLVGFGSFEVKTRAARVGRNPKTGTEIEIPQTKTPVFKAGNLRHHGRDRCRQEHHPGCHRSAARQQSRHQGHQGRMRQMHHRGTLRPVEIRHAELLR